MSAAIEDYALIGDGNTAALIARDGSLDWLCWPRFDSEACFAALLGGPEHGHWLLGPASPARVTRRYLSDTLVLETTFETATGRACLLDFMAIDAPHSSVVRLLVGQQGHVVMRMRFAPRFDYGSLLPWIEPFEQGLLARAGSSLVRLQSPVPMQIEPHLSAAEFAVSAGRRLPFVLAHGGGEDPLPTLDAERALERSCAYWRDWIARFERPTSWPDAVRRSLLTLRALIYRPTGGLIAAPTTSLPERFGGANNYDYRYSWLRDSTFMLTALLNAGFHDEAYAWRDWLLRAIGGEPGKMRPLYRVDGSREAPEYTLDWLPGYAESRPVRVGNAASRQHQGDIYGEVIDSLELATRAGIAQSAHGKHVERGIVQYLESGWNRPDQGIWESRGEPRHYTYSRVMAWVGVDRFLRSAARHGHVDEAWCERLRALCRRIHQEICREGCDARLGRFVQHYGGKQLDASLLLLPLVGFIDVDDPRMANTIAAVERELMRDGLVVRQESELDATAFLACTCWLADCRRLQGRIAEAREAVERVLSVRNDLGLLSEEYSFQERRLCGNFPQGLSHLAVVNAALSMSGPVLQRGGG